MACCDRAHVIKAVCLIGILFIILNLYNYGYNNSKIETPITPLRSLHGGDFKRTRTTSEISNLTQSILQKYSNIIENNTTKKVKVISNNMINTTLVTSLNIIDLNDSHSFNNNIINNNNNNNHIIMNKLFTGDKRKSMIENITYINSYNNSDQNILNIKSDTNLSDNTSYDRNQATHNAIKDNNNNNNINISPFLQHIMTKLGLNKCPPTPPNLVGPIYVNTTIETLQNLETYFQNKLLPGGWYKPIECNANDRVAIIVPYRDRASHLPVFLQNLHPFLMKQQIEYGIFIIEQITEGLFNRASLMNVGYVEALKLNNWNCFIFHDVDLLPMNDRNLYVCPDQPRHMSVAVDTMEFKLPYSSIFGGVSAMTTEQFKTVNGFSNSFWGWGGEDDDMSNRLKHGCYHIARYPINIARYTMLNHKKEKANPKRYEKLVNGAKKYDVDGLNSLRYTVQNLEKKVLYTWILVKLKQDSKS